jgi:DMSO/TMAO reductase YedYZ molybdopterin-dependent catalytic subunit
MVFRSLGLKRPKVDPALVDRVPPGQQLTDKWPVLHYGSVPPFDPGNWSLEVVGLVETPLRYGWLEFQQLPQVDVTADMHCVTRWSRLDNRWGGVNFQTVLDLAKPRATARFVMFHCDGGYTTNVPLAVLEDDDVLLALRHDGEPLTEEHGFPLRAVVPKRYAWKSAKWLRTIEFMDEDRLGFWERYGYHNNADFWNEERFA